MTNRIPFLAPVAVFLALIGGFVLIYLGLSGRLDVHSALQITEVGSIEARPELKKDVTNPCKRSPCLVVSHDENQVEVLLYEHAPTADRWEERLKTTVQMETDSEGQPNRLSARHKPTNDIEDELNAQGIVIEELREPVNLLTISGTATWTEAEIDLPYGILPQYFLNAFQKVDQAMGYGSDRAELTRMANVAAAQVGLRFGLNGLDDRVLPSQIIFGRIQTLTYFVALIALVLTVVEVYDAKLRKHVDTITDLIPFTGFLGTLLGVLGALGVLGTIDITNETLKALVLGRVGNYLSLAINTTITAIVVFGVVILTQSGIRMVSDLLGGTGQTFRQMVNSFFARKSPNSQSTQK